MNDELQLQQEAPQKQKAKAAVDLILDTATEVEGLTKVKALNLANKLVEDIDNNSFRLGGVLKVIYENSWFEGFETFGAFVAEKFGFQERKAKYLMEIYDHLVTKQIPWEKVSGLGWTKLKDLARHLTHENVDEWVEKASKLTVTELQAVLKGDNGGDGEGTSKEASSDTSTIKFKVKADQLDTITSALAKAKAETGTEYDNVALEMICTGYLGGSVGASGSLEEAMKAAGWEGVLGVFEQLFPDITLTVEA